MYCTNSKQLTLEIIRGKRYQNQIFVKIRFYALLFDAFSAVGAVPFHSMKAADVGDLCLTPYDLKQSVAEIRTQFTTLIKDGCKTLTLGGDHTITYPILRALKVSTTQKVSSEI